MNPNRQFKNDIYEQFSRIGKAVSNTRRLELLDILCQGERTVEGLARERGHGTHRSGRTSQPHPGRRCHDSGCPSP